MKLLSFLFLITSLFPWVSFGILDLDIQPYFILFSILLVVVNLRMRLPLDIWLLLLVAFSAVYIALVYGVIDFLTLRGIASYVSVFFVTAAFYFTAKRYPSLVKSCVINANIIWLVVASLQAFFGKFIFDMIVHVRTTDDRGVTSLAPEPTFLGLYLIFISWIIINLHQDKKLPSHIKILLILNFLCILFLAKSSMSILLLLILIGIKVGLDFFSNFKRVFITLFFLTFLIPTLNLIKEKIPNSRIVQLSMMVVEGPVFIAEKDASINERLRHIVFPLHGAVQNYLIPNGFHSFTETSTNLQDYYNGFFWHGSSRNKIMSGFGAPIFELGVISFIYFYFMMCRICQGNKNKKSKIFQFIGINILMFCAIPITFPLFALLVLTCDKGLMSGSRRLN